MDVYESVKDRLAFRDDPSWDAKDKPAKLLIAIHELTGAVLVVYENLRGDVEGQEALSAAIVRLHDEYIAPIDIPGIGPFVEPVLDRNLGPLLGNIVKPLDAKLDDLSPYPAE